MANSDLKRKTWAIPPKYIKLLKQTFNNYKGDKKVEGYVRLKNLITQANITYENLKNIKHIIEKNKSNAVLYRLNGGEVFEKWINDTLSTARKQIESSKKTKKEAGESNAYIKSHEKDSSKGNNIRTPKLHKSMSANDIYNNNVNYEHVDTTKLIITEKQYKQLFVENTIKVYRGVGLNYFGDEINQGFLWVSEDEGVAKNYSELDKDGNWNVESYVISEPNYFEFPYKENTYVTSENIANIFRQLMIRKIKSKEMSKEEWLYLKERIKEYEVLAGDNIEPYHTKLNKHSASNVASEILKLLGYDAVMIQEGGVKTYGIINKNIIKQSN